ncbi:MAG: HD domain-containing phosphohydrolase [Phycisphaerae bacterium]
MEADLLQANQILTMITECHHVLVRIDDEKTMMQETCRIILEIGGYRMAWVGYAEHDEAKSVRPVASAGFEDGYLEKVHITWADTERGRGPTGVAIRTGRTCIGRDFLTNPQLAPWRDQAVRRGYRSSVALPLACDGPAFGALMIYAKEVNAFSERKVTVLSKLAEDLARRIAGLQTKRELRESQQKLKTTLQAFIRALESTLAIRDPYTAGHQRRVAHLAGNIAAKMKCPSYQIDAIETAGVLHDIGKIAVPLEILSKPGRLNSIEQELIRTHVSVSYDILKEILFPWPIATIVLQHHERADGSGYPKGLRADQTTPEARILAVADVVEAMMSHRPYRPALGQDAALGEIQGKSGTLYDPLAVAACMEIVSDTDEPFGPEIPRS